jgi:alpha-glucosidase
MPKGEWREFDFEGFDGGRDSEDPDQARLFVRAGGIVHTGPVHQHFGDRPDQRDELTLIVALDENGAAAGELYEDAGEGWGFRDGAFLRTRHTAETVGDTVVIRTETLGGNLPRPERELVVRLLLDDGSEINATGRDGQPLRVQLNR